MHGSQVYLSHPIIAKFIANEQETPKKLCPCCFGAISFGQIENLASEVVAVLLARDIHSCTLDTPICIEVQVPPTMDAIRITSRTVFTRHPDKLFPYPAIDELLVRVLGARLGGRLNIVPSAAAKVKVSITLIFFKSSISLYHVHVLDHHTSKCGLPVAVL